MPASRVLSTVCLAKALRTAGFGSISVILALFLAHRGFSAWEIGAIFSATLIEDAVVTALVSAAAWRIGTRRILVASSFLVVACALALAFAPEKWMLVLAAIFGIVSPAGYEGGPFSPIEQTLVAKSVPAAGLTRALSLYNLIGFGGAALGALGTGVWMMIYPPPQAYTGLFLIYATGGLLLAVVYAFMPPAQTPAAAAEDRADTDRKQAAAFRLPALNLSDPRSAGHIRQLAALQSLDSFAGGFVVQSLVSLWFFSRYQAGPEFLGPVFFLTNTLAAASFLLAPYIAKRIGLLNTMVFTHLPSSIALCLVPLMPTAHLAAAVLVVRSLLSSMDIPTRQAFAMLLVPEADRPAAAGLTMAGRAVGQGTAPFVSGLLLANPLAGLPFVIAGALKSAYDLSLYFCFRGVPLPLEADLARAEKTQSSGAFPVAGDGGDSPPAAGSLNERQ